VILIIQGWLTRPRRIVDIIRQGIDKLTKMMYKCQTAFKHKI